MHMLVCNRTHLAQCAAAAALLGCAKDTLPHRSPRVKRPLVDTLSVHQAGGLRVLALHICR